MFDLHPTGELLEHCRQQVKIWSFGKRSEFNGSQEDQFIGLVGESTIREAFDIEWVTAGDDFEIDYDLLYYGLKIDVKTHGRTVYPTKSYANLVLDCQIHHKNDIYIFCSYHKTNNVLTVCGVITKNEFVEKSIFYPKGSFRDRSNGTFLKLPGDTHEILNEQLYNVDSLDDLNSYLIFFQA